jgi:hypothetical protein
MSDDALQDLVVESLQKMASLAGKRAVKYNSAVRDFLDSAVAEKDADEPSPMEGLRDAMGHHVSNYNAAKQAGDKDAAEKHLKQFTKLGHLASKLDSASKTIADFEPGHDGAYRSSIRDSAKFDAPDLQAWQSTSPQHFADKNKSSGVDITGWRAWDKQTGVRSKGDGVSAPNKMSFDWYANDPHSNHRDTPGHTSRGNNKGYPFEAVKINDKYLPIGIEEYKGKYQEHPFDNHPIVQHFDESPEEHAKSAEVYKNRLSGYHASPSGHSVATKSIEMSRPEHGAKSGFVVHPPKNKEKE